MPEILMEKTEEQIEALIDAQVEPVAEVAETKVTAKQIITGLVATATIVGGIVINFPKTTPKMSYEEAQKLIEVYDHELKQSPDKSVLGVNNENIVSKLNDKFSKRAVIAEEDLGGEKVNPSDYKILRSGLMEKSE